MDQRSQDEPEYYICYCEECAPKVEALIARLMTGKNIDEEKVARLSFIGKLVREEKNLIQVSGKPH